MSSSTLATIGSGTIFGAALTLSGVYSPSIIISQMRFQNGHMLQAFMTASATSALVMVAAKRLGLSQYNHRSASTLGWICNHDGNIIGGLLLGFGMALTGACPGTVLVQVATGIRSGYLALAGGLVGGFLYMQLGPYLRKPVNTYTTASTTQESGQKGEGKPLTVYERFSMKESHAIFYYEIMCLIVIISTTYLTPGSANVFLHPIIGGLLIGSAQAASLALTGNAVGVSTAYVQISQLFHHFFSSSFGAKGERKLPAFGSVAFATGILAGSYMLGRAIPIPVPGGDIPISIARAVSGGTVMVFGARLAGGCTSGHGISGMSTLSISSIVTMASTFAGGMGLAALIR